MFKLKIKIVLRIVYDIIVSSLTYQYEIVKSFIEESPILKVH